MSQIKPAEYFDPLTRAIDNIELRYGHERKTFSPRAAGPASIYDQSSKKPDFLQNNVDYFEDDETPIDDSVGQE